MVRLIPTRLLLILLAVTLNIMVLSCSISSEKAEEEITLAFVGDIMLGRHVGRAMQKAADPALPFRSVYHEIASADISIGNLECVFVDTLITGTYTHEVIRFPAYGEAVAGLKLAGFDCCSIANNHAMDYGIEGVRSTITTLENNGIKPSGLSSSKPTLFRTKGFTIALFSIWIDNNELRMVDSQKGYTVISLTSFFKDVEEAKKTSDCVIAYPHWGTEYTSHPSEAQTNFAHTAIQMGANLVVGHGPH